MALAIGVKKGSALQIGKDRLEVLEVRGLEIHVQFSKEEGGDIWLDDQERQQVFDQVWVSTAKSKNRDGLTRLVFEAPREIKITRCEEDHAAQVE